MMSLSAVLKHTDRLYTFFAIIGALLLVMMAVAVLVSVISRIAGAYISGLTHMAGYLMAASNCLALAYTFRQKEHIRITLFICKMNENSRERLEKVLLIFSFTVCLYVTFYMFRLSYYSWFYSELATGTNYLKLWVPQGVSALGFFVLCCAIIQETIERFFNIQEKTHIDAQEV